MQLQYLSDNSGRKSAVVIPIEDWDMIKKAYPEVEKIEGGLSQWQKDALDKEIETISANPDYLLRWEDVRNKLRG